MESFFELAIKENLSHSLKGFLIHSVYNEFTYAMEENYYSTDQERLDSYESKLSNIKDIILHNIKEFNNDNSKIYYYLRRQIDYHFSFQKQIDFLRLKKDYEKNYSNPFTNEVFSMSEKEEEFFAKNYKVFLETNNRLEKLLNVFFENYENGLVSNNKEEITNIILDHKPIFVIDDNVDLTMIRKKGREMTDYDQHVIALLFTYLRDNKAILDFNNESLAKLISYLTLTSKNRLLKETITEMDYVRNGICNINKYKENPLKLLGNLRNLISDIFIMIEEDIRKIENK